MKRLSKPVVLMFFSYLILNSGCFLAASSSGFFTKAVYIVAKTAGRWAIAETVEYTINEIFSAIFSKASERTSNSYQNDIVPIAVNGKSGYGQMSYDPVFKVQSGHEGYRITTNTITIPKDLILFYRTSYGTWELTPESKYLVKERTEVATIQQSLKDYGFNPGRVDGIIGPKTRNAIKRFQQKYPDHMAITGELDPTTRQYLLRY